MGGGGGQAIAKKLSEGQDNSRESNNDGNTPMSQSGGKSGRSPAWASRDPNSAFASDNQRQSQELALPPLTKVQEFSVQQLKCVDDKVELALHRTEDLKDDLDLIRDSQAVEITRLGLYMREDIEKQLESMLMMKLEEYRMAPKHLYAPEGVYNSGSGVPLNLPPTGIDLRHGVPTGFQSPVGSLLPHGPGGPLMPGPRGSQAIVVRDAINAQAAPTLAQLPQVQKKSWNTRSRSAGPGGRGSSPGGKTTTTVAATANSGANGLTQPGVLNPPFGKVSLISQMNLNLLHPGDNNGSILNGDENKKISKILDAVGSPGDDDAENTKVDENGQPLVPLNTRPSQRNIQLINELPGMLQTVSDLQSRIRLLEHPHAGVNLLELRDKVRSLEPLQGSHDSVKDKLAKLEQGNMRDFESRLNHLEDSHGPNHTKLQDLHSKVMALENLPKDHKELHSKVREIESHNVGTVEERIRLLEQLPELHDDLYERVHLLEDTAVKQIVDRIRTLEAVPTQVRDLLEKVRTIENVGVHGLEERLIKLESLPHSHDELFEKVRGLEMSSMKGILERLRQLEHLPNAHKDIQEKIRSIELTSVKVLEDRIHLLEALPKMHEELSDRFRTVEQHGIRGIEERLRQVEVIPEQHSALNERVRDWESSGKEMMEQRIRELEGSSSEHRSQFKHVKDAHSKHKDDVEGRFRLLEELPKMLNVLSDQVGMLNQSESDLQNRVKRIEQADHLGEIGKVNDVVQKKMGSINAIEKRLVSLEPLHGKHDKLGDRLDQLDPSCIQGLESKLKKYDDLHNTVKEDLHQRIKQIEESDLFRCIRDLQDRIGILEEVPEE